MFCPVNDVHVPEAAPVLLDVGDRRTEGGDAQASRNEEYVLAMHVFHGKTRPERSPDTNECTPADPEKKTGEVSHIADTELEVPLSARRRRDRKRRFSYAGEFEHEELPRSERKIVSLDRVKDLEVKEAFPFREAVYADDLGLECLFEAGQVSLPLKNYGRRAEYIDESELIIHA